MSPRSIALLFLLSASASLAAGKPTLVYHAPPGEEYERPVITEVTLGIQGTDYAFKIDFDREPWGDACGLRCGNATLFLDTDDKKSTGLRLKDRAAVENGADLVVIIQGVRELKDTGSISLLRVKALQYPEDSTELDQGVSLAELDQRRDPERVVAQGNSVYILIDANVGSLPAGRKVRVVYHPLNAKAVSGTAPGLASSGAGRVEILKEGKIVQPVPKPTPPPTKPRR